MIAGRARVSLRRLLSTVRVLLRRAIVWVLAAKRRREGWVLSCRLRELVRARPRALYGLRDIRLRQPHRAVKTLCSRRVVLRDRLRMTRWPKS